MLTALQQAHRQYGVGGSDIPVIAGLLEKYGRTRAQLLHEKAGLTAPEPPPEEKVYWGHALEPLIVTRLVTQHAWTILPSDTRLGAHPYLYCHPDGIITDPLHQHGHGDGLLEVKNSRFMGKDGPADYHVCQLMYNMGVCRLSWGVLAVLVGGCELKEFVYQHDQGIFDRLVTLATMFWQDVESLRIASPTPLSL